MSRTRLPGLLLIAVAALGMTGCGVGADAGAGPTTTSTQTPGQPADQTLDEVAVDLGGTDTGPGDTADGPQEPAPAEPTAEDCVGYNPANLSVVASGDAWLLRDGGHAIKQFDTQADAEDARRVARNWKQLCWIGRGNTGSERYRLLLNYFAQPSGLPLGPAPVTVDCITYDPDDLAIYAGPAHPAEPANQEWALHAGPVPLHYFATEADAVRGRIVAEANTRLCVIGDGNDRPDPYRYRLYWWRQ